MRASQKNIWRIVLFYFQCIYIVPPAKKGGVEPPTRFSERGGLTGPQFLEGGCWERGGDFFQGGGGGCNFSTQNKLNFGVFNDKKSF